MGAGVDPEQIYQEVLQEEQQKGSAGPVAEGRAKAARVRAEHGSPHPKEPKWWPGAQPQLEGGEAATEVPAETVEEAPVEEPAAEAPAAEPEPAPAAEPPAAAPASAEQPAPASAEQPAPAAVATAPAQTTGVSPGTPTGTRLRPEDAVTNEAQFTGQQAMYERRRLIDEVIRTGVPAAAAAERERSGSGALAILYLLIPILVIAFVVANRDGGTEAASENGGGSETQGESEPGGGGNTIAASGIAFDTDEITAEAGAEVTGTLANEDTVTHNIAFYNSEDETSDPSNAFYTSPDASGGSETEFSFTAPDEPGDYPFVCDYHPTTMTGTLVVESGGGGGGG